MNRQSQRLRRVLRKYALDAQLARIAQAKAERERATLASTGQRLVAARNALACENGILAGDQLAALGEWSDRLVDASIALQPAIHRADISCTDTLLGMQQATGRVEQLEERILHAKRTEDRRSDHQSIPNHNRRKIKQDTQP